ncbi:MAG: serine/threonine protein kinase [Planctomycetia bacterium]|nr:serine/threonine protein kinase [Planctomycetia bacterium]
MSEVLPEARKFNDPRAFAQHLLKRNWLTPYQVNQLFQGQANGLVLGQYRLLERIGEGGMGQVFRARHQAMGRIVALKVIRRERLDNEKAVQRFFREIRAAARLTHPNIVQAFDADSVSGTHFLAMEYVDGIDLSRLVKQRGPLPLAEACEYIRQSALGLQHAHELGMVHRDIKPGNLLVPRDASTNGAYASTPAQRGKRTGHPNAKPVVKILDLGLARVSFHDDADHGFSLSQDGTVMGTPDYMSPEQAKNSHQVDWRADIYSLGCTFYYMLAGQVPFPGGSNIEKLVRHQMDQPKPIEQLRPDVPPKVRAILQKMLAKRPDERYQTAGEVAAALGAAVDPNQTGPITPIPPAKGATRPLPKLPLPPTPAPATNTMPALPRPSPTGPPSTPRRPAVAAPPVPAAGDSTSLALIKGLFIDRATQKVRALGIVILAMALLGVLALFFVVLTLISGLAQRNSGGTAVASVRRPMTPATTAKTVTPPPTERRAPTHEPVFRFLPDTANNVVVYRIPEIVRSRVYRDNDVVIKQSMLAPRVLLENFGIDLFADVDVAVSSLPSSPNATDFCYIFQGAFNARKFQEGIDRVQSRPRRPSQKLPNVTYYELISTTNKNRQYIGLVTPTTVLYANDERTMTSAYQKQHGLRRAELSDVAVQRALENLEDKPPILMVLGGSVPLEGGGTLLQGEGSPGIRGITFGFRPGDDVQAKYIVTARDATTLQSLRPDILSLMQGFLRFIDATGMLSAPLANLTPVVNEREHTFSFDQRYTGAQVARIINQK